MFSVIFTEFGYYKFCLYYHYLVFISSICWYNPSYRYRLWCRGISKLRRWIASILCEDDMLFLNFSNVVIS